MALRKWTGAEVGPEIINAIERIPRDSEIVEFKAGDNMPITCAFVGPTFHEGGNGSYIPEYAWDGLKWVEIGFL